MKNAATLITLKNAGAQYGSRWAVRGVDLTVKSGEIVTLIGPNGSGKSTTLRLALGIETPSEGEAIKRDGIVVGYVPQRMSIDWSLPMRVDRFLQLTNRLRPEQIKHALELTDTVSLIHEEVRTLSGGELQRVLLARAIARKPDILVLDEPTQGVDFAGELKLYELIAQIRDELGCGVLLVSHDLHVVMAATDHVVCLNGHVCCSGAPMAVAQTEAYKELFGSAGAATLAVYQHNHDHEHLPDGRVLHSDGSITDHCHPDDGHHHDHSSPAGKKESEHAG